MTFKVVDSKLPYHYCSLTYLYAEMSNQWREGGTDLLKEEVKENHSSFPIMPVIKDGETQQWHPFCGWFMCVGQMLAEIASKEWGLSSYDTNLQRVHLVAHRPGEGGLVVPHKDHDDSHCSVIWHLSRHPWDNSWGGTTWVNGENISFKPNRIITFPSHIDHYGTPPKSHCPHNRIVLNVVFRVGDVSEWRRISNERQVI